MLACDSADLDSNGDIIHFLIENGSDVNAIALNGNTPLMLACRKLTILKIYYGSWSQD